MFRRNNQGCHLQDSTPVQSEDEDGEASAVQNKPDPVEVEEEIPCQFLSMKHTEGWWIWNKSAAVNATDILI